MGKLTFSVGKDAADQTADEFEYYDGPMPTRGVYRFELKRLRIKNNRNDDPMLNMLLSLNENERLKKKYNGFTMWSQQNVTQQGAPYVNQFLTALGLSKPQIKSFWSDGCVTDDETPPNVLKLGKTFKVKDSGLFVYVDVKSEPYNGETRLAVRQYVVPKNKSDKDEDAEEAAQEDRAAELAANSVEELQAAAKKAGVKGSKKMDKDTLIAAILEAADDEEGDGDNPF